MLEGLQTENWKAKLVIRGRREQRAGGEAPRRPPPPRLAASELHVPACGWFQEMLLTFLPRAHPGWDPGGTEPCVKQSDCPQIRVSTGTRWTWFWQFPLELTVPETRSAWSPGGGVHVPPRIGGGGRGGVCLQEDSSHAKPAETWHFSTAEGTPTSHISRTCTKISVWSSPYNLLSPSEGELYFFLSKASCPSPQF